MSDFDTLFDEIDKAHKEASDFDTIFDEIDKQHKEAAAPPIAAGPRNAYPLQEEQVTAAPTQINIPPPQPWQYPGFYQGPLSSNPFSPYRGEAIAEAQKFALPSVMSAATEQIGKLATAAANVPTTLANLARGATPENPAYVSPLQEVARPLPPKFPGNDIPTGIVNAAVSTGMSMLPPFAPPEVGLTLPLLAAGGGTGKIAGALYGQSMASSIPQQIQNAVSVAESKDASNADISEAIAAPVISALMAGGMLKHAGAEAPTPGLQGPPAPGALLNMPRGALPPIADIPKIERLAADAAEAAAKRMQREATASYEPPPSPRAEVPATPAQAYETAVQEARRQGADTINKILKLFPSLEGNRTRAREIRDIAFPEKKGPEYARSQQETAAVHGDLRPLAGESAGQLPVEESRQGVQPQTEGGIPNAKAQQSRVLLTPEEQAAEQAALSEALGQTEGAKEPWQMTRSEYRRAAEQAYVSRQESKGKEAPSNIRYSQSVAAGERHRKTVQNAIKRGKPVPPEVLADYPDLVKPTTPLPGTPPTEATPAKEPSSTTLAEPAAQGSQGTVFQSAPEAKAQGEQAPLAGAISEATPKAPVAQEPLRGDFGLYKTKEQRETALAKLKEINAQAQMLADKGGLTAVEAMRFRTLSKQANDLRFSLARENFDESKIPSESERKSTLPADIVATARKDLLKNRNAYDAIVEAATGVYHAARTAVDDIIAGQNPNISFKQLYDTFAATREALRKKYGDTMTLFRAPTEQQSKPTTNWATTKEFAEQFGKNVISKEIPIDDIVAVNVGLHGKYHELIVAEKPQAPVAQASFLDIPVDKWTPEYWKRIGPEGRRVVVSNLQGALEKIGSKTKVTDRSPREAVFKAIGEVNEAYGSGPGMVGMGGAALGEVSEGAGADIYGIAQRVREARAKAGVTTPVEPGEGITGEQAIARGRELIAKGYNAPAALVEFEKTGKTNADLVFAVRAYGENLAREARRVEEQYGTESPEWLAAAEKSARWDERTKPLATLAHKMMVGHQLATDVDTGSVIGLQRYYQDLHGKEFTSEQRKQAEQEVANVQETGLKAEAQVTHLFNKIDEAIPTKVPTPKTAEEARQQLGEYQTGGKMNPKQIKTIWNYVKQVYISSGHSDLMEITRKAAVDLGIPQADVIRAMAEPKGARQISNEAWLALRNKQLAIYRARRWVEQAAMGKVERTLRKIPRAMFTAKVIGHGGVGMITHAGNMIFQPSKWSIYWRNFGKQYKLWRNPAYHAGQMAKLAADPNFAIARRAKLANDPYQFFDDYQNPQLINYFDKIGLIGGRGFDALKLARQETFNQFWKPLPESMKNLETAKLIADRVNHMTGIISSSLGRASEPLAVTFFAPKLEASRWMFAFGDPAKAAKIFANWKEATPAEKMFATAEFKQKAEAAGVLAGMLIANQAILSAFGSDQKINFTNPHHSDWLAFKGFGQNIRPISPLVGMFRLLADSWRILYGKRSQLESLESSRQEVIGKPTEYLQGKLSPFAQPLVDIVTRATFDSRPLPHARKKDKVPPYMRKRGIGRWTWPEYLANTAAPIPLAEALRETWRSEGMNEDQINRMIKFVSVFGFAGFTGVRLSEDYYAGKR